MTRPPLDPDPLTVAPEPVRRDEPDDSGMVLVWVAAVAVVAVAVGFLLLALLAVAAPRSSSESTLPADVSGQRSTPATTGAPPESRGGPGSPPAVSVTGGAPLSPAVGSQPARIDASTPGSTRYAGVATWYCGHGSPCTRGYGPSDLVAAIDTDLGFAKGERVTVRFGERAVTVRIVDVCACPGERLIDLTTGAFRRLAPLAYGVLPVTVEAADVLPTLPATETEDQP